MTKEDLINLQSFKTEEEYRSSSSINYSVLKEIPNGPKCLIDQDNKVPSSAFIAGSYVDNYFTNKENFDKLYYKETVRPKLTESIEILFQVLAAEGKFNPTMDECVEKCREYKLYASVKSDEKLKNKIPEELFARLKMEEECKGKMILTQDQLFQASCAIDNINSFQPALNLFKDSDYEIAIPQFKWEFALSIDGDKKVFKVMYDVLRFNKAKKKISAIELKTGSKPTHKFGDQFFEYRYDIQCMLYFMGMQALQRKHFPDWNIPMYEDYKFVYTRKAPSTQPIIVPLSSDLYKYYYDSNFEYNGMYYECFLNILKDVNWYLNNNEFVQHRKVAETFNVVSISELIF